jgi:hypothetical protein
VTADPPQLVSATAGQFGQVAGEEHGGAPVADDRPGAASRDGQPLDGGGGVADQGGDLLLAFTSLAGSVVLDGCQPTETDGDDEEYGCCSG